MLIYTDGGCEPNPGYGSWAFVVLENEQKQIPIHEQSGICEYTTNNRMEMQAILEAMKWALDTGIAEFKLFSDSELCVNQAKGLWRAKKNKDLVQKVHLISSSLKFRRVKFSIEWVRGHNNCLGNELADMKCSLLLAERK